jgi:hypothetical protein
MKYPTWDQILPQLLLKLGEKAKKKKRQKLKTSQNELDKATLSSKNEICTHESKSQTNMSLNHDETVWSNNQERQQKTPVTAGKTPKELSEKISKESVCLESEIEITKNSLAEVKRFTEVLKAKNNTVNANLDVINIASVASTCTTTEDPFFMCEDSEPEFLTSIKVDIGSDEGGPVHKGERLSESIKNKNDEKRFFQAERRKSIQEQKLRNSNFRAVQQQSANISGSRHKQSSYSRQKMSVLHHEKKQSLLTGNKIMR